MCRDSSVSIAACYGLDGPGIESLCRRDFPHPSRPALGPTQPPIQWAPRLSPGVKRPGRGVDCPPPSSPEVKERVQLYLYSPSGPPWPDVGWPLPLFMYAREHVKRRQVQRFAVLFRHQGVRAHRPSDEHEAHVMSCHLWERTGRERHLDVSELTLLIAVSF